ncbi:polyphosphate kinase 1 [Pedobacter cryotolerans]|uniref:Polyphosphate kinase n=1 Tax=Pedobacter cryotolerans TaxID=2571270 RepID=A0A4U1C3M6_9SPHI|nr:polyphosphate kinase 1 [Pedobacter cryotolerans]TKB99887.1 polyphosphate kinase 1 [Pedobacter cryotolerans]
MIETVAENTFFDRDLSWLSFNGRVLSEASNADVPLLEKIKFLSIYSSNLDEFYRVRMPVLLALAKLSRKKKNHIQIEEDLLDNANRIIHDQQSEYGRILAEIIKPQLLKNHINFVYGIKIPDSLIVETSIYFVNQVMAFLQPVNLSVSKSSFFPKNNELYLAVNLVKDAEAQTVILNIPTNNLPRFYQLTQGDESYVLFLDDIIKNNLALIFKDADIQGCYSFKITRTAEIDLKDEYAGDLAKQIEKQLSKRDFGLATRFLHQPDIPAETLLLLQQKLNLQNANLVAGGHYHNLKDLASFPVDIAELSNDKWTKINYPAFEKGKSLYHQIIKNDILINPPYQSYDSVLRFFNEAAVDEDVQEIYITLYRVASDSRIVNALISAAKNGKKVFVLVELKARFDEANNIKWANKMKEAGVDIIYSVTALKVHAKIALVKRKVGLRTIYTGLFSTGNFNETTANFYTDHVLMTAHQEMLREMELLFMFLAKRVKPSDPNLIKFQYLLVAQFNLQQRFIELIDREMEHAKSGKSASIIIKLNNLEEKVLIAKLYEASKAGVKVELIIRGISRLIAGVKDMSENISVRRIVDRYLEHGRVFVFNNAGNEEIFMGSADWMNRNIYRRIEVCFPVLDQNIKHQIKEMLNIQLADTSKAVLINEQMENVAVTKSKPLQSQYEIYKFLKEEKYEN